jgi:hypothetical protein
LAFQLVAGAEAIAVAKAALSARWVSPFVGKAHPELVLAVIAIRFTLESAPQPTLVSAPIVGTFAKAGKGARPRHQRLKFEFIHHAAPADQRSKLTRHAPSAMPAAMYATRSNPRKVASAAATSAAVCRETPSGIGDAGALAIP